MVVFKSYKEENAQQMKKLSSHMRHLSTTYLSFFVNSELIRRIICRRFSGCLSESVGLVQTSFCWFRRSSMSSFLSLVVWLAINARVDVGVKNWPMTTTWKKKCARFKISVFPSTDGAGKEQKEIALAQLLSGKVVAKLSISLWVCCLNYKC